MTTKECPKCNWNRWTVSDMSAYYPCCTRCGHIDTTVKPEVKR